VCNLGRASGHRPVLATMPRVRRGQCWQRVCNLVCNFSGYFMVWCLMRREKPTYLGGGLSRGIGSNSCPLFIAFSERNSRGGAALSRSTRDRGRVRPFLRRQHMQCSAVQCSAAQRRAVQRCAMQCYAAPGVVQRCLAFTGRCAFEGLGAK
jgi:hypothetical protein